MLERRGVISGYEGSKPRQVLITEADLPRVLGGPGPDLPPAGGGAAGGGGRAGRQRERRLSGAGGRDRAAAGALA